MSRRSLWFKSALTYHVTFDRAGNVRPRLDCGSCARPIANGDTAAVQVQPFVRLVCGGCVVNLDANAQVVPMRDFFAVLLANAGLADMLRPGIEDELLPVLAA